ncbi:uncharacterized protein METZ01_LOCUS165145 [marine metagenome]|uniref:Uncharacterized protein n=1 Tax=marine metagenome TaxID=408172 RepID=A0A382BFM1_9ZZZZ
MFVGLQVRVVCLLNVNKIKSQNHAYFTKRGLQGSNPASLLLFWWAQEDSNLRPSGYEPGALPTEL